MARSAPLEPGENDIDRRSVVDNGKGGYRLQWSIMLPDGKLKRCKTELSNATKGAVKRRAKEQADMLLKSAGSSGAWTLRSQMSDYIRQVSMPEVENSKCRDNTKRRYRIVLNLLADAWSGYSIADAVKPRCMQDKLNDIARKHGTTTATQCRKVASRWVLKPLEKVDCVLNGIKLPSTPVEITVQHCARKKPKGGQAVPEGEWRACVDYMLGLDPSEVSKRGAYTIEQRIAQRRAVVEMTMLQAVTGLRISEARTLTWDKVHVTQDGMKVEITPDISKTHKGRFAAVLDPRVADRILARPHTDPEGRVFPTPTTGTGEWDRQNCQKAMNKFMRTELSKVSPMLAEHSSHVWRSTLATIADRRGVSEAVNAAQFGHSVQVDREYYNDQSDTADYVREMMGAGGRHE